MDKKIKVTNPNNHHVGVIFMNGIERNIPPKGFVLATEDCTIVKEVDTNYKENVPSTAA